MADKKVNIIITGQDKTKAALSSVQSGFDKVGASLRSTGKSLTTGLTLPIVALGTKIASVAGSFESQMNVLSIAARSSGTAMNELQEAAVAVGGDTRLVGINAAEAAGAMTDFYKAGLTTTEIFGDLNSYLEEGTQLSGALRAAVDLQAASELDLAAASDVVSIAMATFGLGAEDAVDISDSFVRAADASVASVGELADAMSNIGPTAAAFGYTLEDTNTALAILSGSGIKGAEAGTALKSMMVNLMRPTDEVTQALDNLNVSLYDQNRELKDMPTLIGELGGALAGLTQKQRLEYIQTLAGTYGMKAMNTLLAAGVIGWEDMETAIASAAGVQESAAARTEGLGAAWETLKGVVETFMITAGMPLIQNFLTPLIKDHLIPLVEKLSEADPKFLALGVSIAGVLAVAGPLMMVLGTMQPAVSLLVGGVGKLAIALVTTVIPALATLDVSIGLAIIALQDMAVAAWASVGPYALIAAAIFGLVKAYQAISKEGKKHDEELAKRQVTLQAEGRAILDTSSSYDGYVAAIMQTEQAQYGLNSGMDEAMVKQTLMRQGILETETAWGILSGRVLTSTKVNIAAISAERDALSKFGDDFPFFAQQVTDSAAVVTDSVVAIGDSMAGAWEIVADSSELEGALQKRQSIIDSYGQSVLTSEENTAQQRAQVQFTNEVQRLMAETQYQAQLKQLQDAGDTEGIARLTANYNESQVLTEWNVKVQEQLAERAELEQTVVERRKYLTLLVTQQEALKLSLKTDILAAQAKGELQKSTATQMLKVLGVSLTGALKTEQSYQGKSSDVWWKWASDRKSAAEVGVSSMAAVLAAYDQDLAEAEKLLADAQAELNSFTLEMPELVLPGLDVGDLGGVAGGTAAAAKEAAQKVVGDVTSALANAISAGKDMIKNLVGFELTEGWETGLEKFGILALAVSKKFAEIWKSSQDQLKTAAEAAPGIQAIGKAFSSLAEAVNSVTKIEDLTLDEFQVAVWGYMERIRLTTAELLWFFKNLSQETKDLIEEAAPVSKNLKEVFGILGTDLAKMVPYAIGGFESAMWEFTARLRFATAELLWFFKKLSPETKALITEAAPIAKDLKEVFSILGIELGEIEIPEKGFLKTLTSYLLKIEGATNIAMEVLGRIKTKFGDMLATGAETMKSTAEIWMGLADITKAIDDAANLGGPDIAAAQAMARMLNELMLGHPGLVGGSAAANLPVLNGAGATGAGASTPQEFTFKIGNIMIEIPGMGKFETGAISQRVKGGEGDMVDLRISMAAASI